MCNFHKKKKKWKRPKEKGPAPHTILCCPVKPVPSLSPPILWLCPPHISPQFPPLLSALQTWKNSLDSLTAALSVWNYSIKKKQYNCENRTGCLLPLFSFLCFFLRRMKNSWLEVCIIGAAHHNDNKDFSARCQSAELMRLMWARYWTSDLYIAQQPQITG